jgi:hypothetical protein
MAIINTRGGLMVNILVGSVEIDWPRLILECSADWHYINPYPANVENMVSS